MSELNLDNDLDKDLNLSLDLAINLVEYRDLDSFSGNEIDELGMRLTALLEQSFQLDSQYPSIEAIQEHFKVTEFGLNKMISEICEPKLKARGLPSYFQERNNKLQTRTSFEETLDPLFILACNKLLDPSSTMSFNARMKELKPLGIDSRKWSNWIKIPEYSLYARKMFEKAFDTEVELNAKMALARNIQTGDLQSIKYYMELQRKFVPQSDLNTQMLIMMLSQLMNILSKHVSPEILEAVAEEIEFTDIKQLMP